MKQLIFTLTLFLSFFLTLALDAQNGTVNGTITDADNQETLISCTVILQGTSLGASTDIDGKYEIPNVPPGEYNLVVSYVSYETQIVRITVPAGSAITQDVALKSASVSLEAVTVTATRRTDTETSVLNLIKTSNLVVSGISSQQITRSQDRDASEVVRRIPGVTIRDGRFVIVRGLIERYNTVWLNNASTPSSEADIRAFSFDVVPSSAIDRILIFKTPAPELPADFAGAAIQIFTKSNADENSFSASYSMGYNNQATFNEGYEKYEGSPTDWLGYDNGTRDLPDIYPDDPTEVSRLENNVNAENKAKIDQYGRAFNKIWTTSNTTPFLNQSANVTLARRFLIGNVSIGNITALTYSNNNGYFNAYRAAYDGYDVPGDRPFTRLEFDDDRSNNTVRLGGLMNWLLIFGNNQRIEFRNILNQSSEQYTNSRVGYDNGNTAFLRQQEFFYQSRLTYSGQLSGTHKFKNDIIQLNWTLGYAFANRDQPDTRRITSALSYETFEFDPNAPYTFQFTFNPDPRLFGRLYLDNNENIATGTVNYTHTLALGDNFLPQLKAGFYTDLKDRTFSARNIGFVRGSGANSALFQQSLDEIFSDKNLNYDTGIRVSEKTAPSDSYEAENTLYAGYLALNIPFAKKWNVYAGVRLEDNLQQLSISNTPEPVYNNKQTDFFPSVNATYNFTERSLLRLAYGKSVNRPEFREVAPFVYYDFEQAASIYGNTALRNCYVDNFDLRYEFYPTPGETVTFGGFYKRFDNTIEAHLRQFGSNLSYEFTNTQEAFSTGLELDIRKNFAALADKSGFLRNFKDFTLILNASLINSEVNTDDPTERDSVRVMQGQSPFIVNAGLYYQNDELDLTITSQYNIIGERIVFVGDQDNPHTWELPRNSLDFTLIKGIGKNFQLRAGVRDLLNNKVNWVQRFDFQKPNGEGQLEKVERELPYYVFRPGVVFNLGIAYAIR
jgi:outer membrane receptor for ferrienterochelin and colicin